MQNNSWWIQKIAAPAGSLPLLLRFLLLPIAIILLTSVTLASLDEAYGIVTNVVDGNTFDVTIEKSDPRISYNVERISLADVKSPDIDTVQGPDARDFTFAVLMNKRVYLDIDELSGSGSGRDAYGRLICVAYLTGIYGQPLASPNFNQMLVDSGHASLENEFDPEVWRSGGDLQQIARSVQGLKPPLQNHTPNNSRNVTQKDLLPKLQDYAANELDRAAKEGWDWLKGQISSSIK
jgi:endonuclease YncB( thermonuclease family)